MNRNYDGALVMPSNYAVLEEEEMCYLEGGGTSVKMGTSFLKKSYCNTYAQMTLDRLQVFGMTKLQIAQELYGHAQMFFRLVAVLGLGVDIPLVKTMAKSAAVADIADGGDTLTRRTVYTAIWYGISG